MPPKDSPGILRLEQGVVVGLGNMQLTVQKYPAELSLYSSWGQMLYHQHGLYWLGLESSLQPMTQKTLAALQGTIAGSYPLPLVNKPGLLWPLEGLRPDNQSQLIWHSSGFQDLNSLLCAFPYS